MTICSIGNCGYFGSSLGYGRGYLGSSLGYGRGYLGSSLGYGRGYLGSSLGYGKGYLAQPTVVAAPVPVDRPVSLAYNRRYYKIL